MVKLIWVCLALVVALPFVSGAHFIVGIVEDAADGEPANGKTVVLWNPANGLGDNLTDIVGPTGNSGADNIYFIDCELLDTPCVVGDEVRAMVLDSGDAYLSGDVSGTVTGAGFDVLENITLNSPPLVMNLTVDDGVDVPAGEIDLLPASTKEVNCWGVLKEYEGQDTLNNLTARFFDNSVSSYGASDDNNDHYTNDSCYLDYSYGGFEDVFFNCSFNLEYYANSGDWNCTVVAEDNLSVSKSYNNLTYVNVLLALSIDSPMDFGELNSSEVSSEVELNVSNAGNAQINLSLSGYGGQEGDGLAYNCTGGQDIPVDYLKYNLTAANPGPLSLSAFEQFYQNLTSNVLVREFNLPYRTNDLQVNVDEMNSTYWRVYVPNGVTGNCSGSIIFGAVQYAAD